MPQPFDPLWDPAAITARSFSIIEEELGPHGFSSEQVHVVKRVIHSTADFELGQSMFFHPDAIRAGIEALRCGGAVVTDVQMVRIGIRTAETRRFGNPLYCFISDEDVMRMAQEENVTRAMAAMRKAVQKVPDGALFVIGNAPTALLELVRLVQQGLVRPALIVGVPVGFVSVQESKECLLQLKGVPYITNRGRKGGSPTAAAIINALLLRCEQGIGL